MPLLPYRFSMNASVPLTEAEMTLQLAMVALEGLHGQAAVRLDARYHLDQPGRSIVVDAGTDVGVSLVRVFTSLLIREFGDDAFTVRRARSEAPAAPAAPAAEKVAAA